MRLLLEAVDAAGPLRWRWVLSDEETGVPVAGHEVDLDSVPGEAARFRNLYAYTRSYAAPDRRVTDGARIVADAGAWAGSVLLGNDVAAAIVAAAPVTVRVSVPRVAESALLWPLELAHVDEKPMAARGDVAFVYDIGDRIGGAAERGDAAEADARKDGVGEALRVLAVFSQPTRTSALALRRERYALSRLIRRIAARERAVVELRVAQYGVTRERLAEIADDGGGWDVLHVSGHGGGGLFLLEQADGLSDPVSTADLVDLLRPVRRRVKLAMLSACESAVDTTAQTLRLLGLAEQADALEAAEADAARQLVPLGEQIPGLARALVRQFDCAVVAMRYPVTDEFAMEFGDVFYEHVLGRRHSVDVAVARAVAKAAGPVPSASRPAVSLATPGVFGVRAAGLGLTVPRGPLLLDPADQRMAYCPDEPERFVGRLNVMAAAGAVLAPGSGRAAVLLHGMAGGGKTACALELAYRHQDSFSAVAFWQAPTREDGWEGALADFSNRLEIQLGDYGFTVAAHIGTTASLEAFLPRLGQMMADSSVLLVLDNLETLLTSGGAWRDPRWELLMSTLTGPIGESRVILTSRIVPDRLGSGGRLPAKAPATSRVVTLPVHALSLDEAAVLARELPNLHGLLHADPGTIRTGTGIDIDADRGRVYRVLRVVQGHPKLLELSDAAAANPDTLDAQLAAAEEAAAGQELEAFFRDGASVLDPDQFLHALSAWTVTALAALPEPARLMAHFLACLEDSDRQGDVIDANWDGLWERLERPGRPADRKPALDALVAAALIQVDVPSDAGDHESRPSAYRMHPGVADAILTVTRADFRHAVDAGLGAFWEAVARKAQKGESGEDSGLVVRAGLAASPYLLRLGDWDTASILLEHAIRRDESPGTVQAALPALRRAADATGTPKAVSLLAWALSFVDQAEAEQLIEDAVFVAAQAGGHGDTSKLIADMVMLPLFGGRSREAVEMAMASQELGVIGQKAGRAWRARRRWNRLFDKGFELQTLRLTGEKTHEQVLAEVARLRTRAAELAGRPTANQGAAPWSVREYILSAGCASAEAAEDWPRYLDLNAEFVASKRQRGAGEHEVTRARLNDAWPLIRLGRLTEAGRLLADCQQIFEDHADTALVATVLGVRAGLESQLGHWREAADLARTALRLHYARPEPLGIAAAIAVNHDNLATYLGALGGDRAEVQAHWLAAALLRRLAGEVGDLADIMLALAAGPCGDGAGVPLPSTAAQLVEAAERTEGVRLGALLANLRPHDPHAVEAAFTEALRAVADTRRDNQEDGTDITRGVLDEERVIVAGGAASLRDDVTSIRGLRLLHWAASVPGGGVLVAVLLRLPPRRKRPGRAPRSP
jgi:tetratricopeptide (TPR) repeat protein